MTIELNWHEQPNFKRLKDLVDLRCVRFIPILKTVDIEDSEFVFGRHPNSENGRFGRPNEPSALKGRRFGRLWRDSRFHLRSSKNEANLLVQLS